LIARINVQDFASSAPSSGPIRFRKNFLRMKSNCGFTRRRCGKEKSKSGSVHSMKVRFKFRILFLWLRYSVETLKSISETLKGFFP